MLALDALRGRNGTSQPGGGAGRGSPAAGRRRADRGGQLRGGVGDPGTAAVAATGRRCDVAGHALAEGHRRRGPGGSPGRREGGVSGPAGALLVRARSLDVRYPGGVDLLRGLDLDVNSGVQMVLTGRSGSGKTTLLLVLAGLLRPTTGDVRWPGLAGDARRRRAEIGMVFQAPSLMAELTSLQNVTLPLRLRGEPVDDAHAAAHEALAALDAADIADALPSQLSGGQQQRIAVARALAGRHRLVLADEPTGALDRDHAHEVVTALQDGVAEANGALLVATHDPELAALFGRRVSLTDEAVGAGPG